MRKRVPIIAGLAAAIMAIATWFQTGKYAPVDIAETPVEWSQECVACGELVPMDGELLTPHMVPGEFRRVRVSRGTNEMVVPNSACPLNMKPNRLE